MKPNSLSTKKTIIIFITFIIALSAIRLTWSYFQKTTDHPEIVQGVLDLRGWSIPDETITLNGEWEFFPSQMLKDIDLASSDVSKSERVFIQVPWDWRDAYPNDPNRSYWFGTYRLQIVFDDPVEQPLKLRINDIKSASAVYVNHQLVAQSGNPSDLKETYEAHRLPFTVTIPPQNSDTIQLAIEASNHAVEGGIVRSIRFGTVEAVDRWISYSKNLQIFLCIVLLIHAIYAVILFFIGYSGRDMIYFSLLVFCAILSVLIADDKLLYEWFPYSFEIASKIFFLSYLGFSAFLPLMFKHLLSVNTRLLQWFSTYCIAYSVLIVVASGKTLLSFSFLLSIALFTSILITGYILKSAIQKDQDIIYLLLACASLGHNIVWTNIIIKNYLFVVHYPFDLVITIFAFAAYWFKRYFRANENTRKLAEQLQLANRQKDDFLVNTSHELRNPLHGIVNITQSVLDDVTRPIDEVHRKKLELQIAVSRRMSNMLDDLLDITRLKENTIRLNIEDVHVQSIIPGMIEMLKFMLDGKPIQLIIEMDEHFPAVRADENRLIQILFNLLHNAIKYTDEGKIIVHASTENEWAHIHVTDTGIGIDEAIQEKIFTPYEQGNTNITRGGGGFGIGLSICKQLIELHGGSIQVLSSPGKGSTFTISLPLSKEVSSSDAKIESVNPIELEYTHLEKEHSQSANAKGHKPKILIVDDDSVNLKILTEILGTTQYDIVSVTNSNQAFDQIESETFDLVLSDVMMPHISGYELTRNIRKRFTIAELPVLLITARNRPEDISAGFQAGANDYVSKPVDAWEIRSRVKALIDLKLSIEESLRMEGALLQAQIQPHFIYNTLNSIAALGTIDIEKMQALLGEFSNYLRRSFSYYNSNREVLFQDELSLVHSYLYIEQERFGERIQIEWDIDVEHDFLLPPLSIQTIVENALQHGILPRAGGGKLEIKVRKALEHIQVTVRDNGVGMSKEKIVHILDHTSLEMDGIGLRNTDRRLKQCYGSGLQIQSEINQGTTVTFQIPYRVSKQEKKK